MASDGCAEVAWKGQPFPYLHMPSTGGHTDRRRTATHAATPSAAPSAGQHTDAAAPAPGGTYVTLASGARLPFVGLGTYKIESTEVIRMALAAGYRHFDCASAYGNEEIVGDGLASFSGVRDELFITSKVWQDAHRPALVRESCERTLAQLRVGYLDLYMVHWPDAWRPGTTEPDDGVTLEETWRAMELLVDAGLVRNLGVCNFSLRQLEELCSYARIKPAALQIESHPLLAQRKLVGGAFRLGVQCVGYRSLGKGSGDLLADPTVLRVAKEAGKTPAQVLLRWNVQRGVPVLPKASSAGRLAENMAVLDWSLTNQQKALLDSMDSGKRFVTNNWHDWGDPAEGGASKASSVL